MKDNFLTSTRTVIANVQRRLRNVRRKICISRRPPSLLQLRNSSVNVVQGP